MVSKFIICLSLQVRKHFSSLISGEAGEMWFSYNGSPLRWHHPIGLLHDLLAGVPGQDGHLPWSITVLFSYFPVEQILPCHAREQVESVFMSSLKEADQLKHSGKKNHRRRITTSYGWA